MGAASYIGRVGGLASRWASARRSRWARRRQRGYDGFTFPRPTPRPTARRTRTRRGNDAPTTDTSTANTSDQPRQPTRRPAKTSKTGDGSATMGEHEWAARRRGARAGECPDQHRHVRTGAAKSKSLTPKTKRSRETKPEESEQESPAEEETVEERRTRGTAPRRRGHQGRDRREGRRQEFGQRSRIAYLIAAGHHHHHGDGPINDGPRLGQAGGGRRRRDVCRCACPRRVGTVEHLSDDGRANSRRRHRHTGDRSAIC